MRRPRSPRREMSVPGSVLEDGKRTNFPPMRHVRVKFVAASTGTSMSHSRREASIISAFKVRVLPTSRLPGAEPRQGEHRDSITLIWRPRKCSVWGLFSAKGLANWPWPVLPAIYRAGRRSTWRRRSQFHVRAPEDVQVTHDSAALMCRLGDWKVRVPLLLRILEGNHGSTA